MDDVSDSRLRDSGYLIGAFAAGAILSLLVYVILNRIQTIEWQQSLNAAQTACRFKIKADKLEYKEGVKYGRRPLERILDMRAGEVYLDSDTRTQWSRFDDSTGRKYFSFVQWPTANELRLMRKFSPLQITPQNSTAQQEQSKQSSSEAKKRKEEKK